MHTIEYIVTFPHSFDAINQEIIVTVIIEMIDFAQIPMEKGGISLLDSVFSYFSSIDLFQIGAKSIGKMKKLQKYFHREKQGQYFYQ